MLKIYFGNKPLLITENKIKEVEPYLDDPQTIILEKLVDKQLPSIVSKMKMETTKAGIIFSNVPKALNDLKKEFTVIQASGGLVYANDSVLLIFRRGKWDLPKGKLDEGEDLVSCALREVKEETGLSELTFEQSLCVTYHTYYEGEKHILKESHWHLLRGNSNEVLIPQTDEDIEKCEWVSLHKLTPYIESAPASIVDVLAEGLKILKKKNNQLTR